MEKQEPTNNTENNQQQLVPLSIDKLNTVATENKGNYEM